jgi:hypothetical protein
MLGQASQEPHLDVPPLDHDDLMKMISESEALSAPTSPTGSEASSTPEPDPNETLSDKELRKQVRDYPHAVHMNWPAGSQVLVLVLD